MAAKTRKQRRRALLAIALATYVSAASTTVKMIQPIGSDVPGVVASIVGVDVTATTYAMACGDSFPATVSGYPKDVICGSISALTITQGPSTIAFTTATNIGLARAPPTTIKAALNCKLAEKEAVCTNSFDGVEAAAKMTENLAGEVLEQYKSRLESWKTAAVTTLAGGVPLGLVMVTAGVEKLTGGTAVETSSAGVKTSGSQTTGKASKTTSKSGATATGAQLFNGIALAAGILGVVAL